MDVEFSKKLYDLTNSVEFKTTANMLNLSSYAFEILTQKHRNDLLNIICYQFSREGGNPLSVMLNTSVDEIFPKWCVVVDHAIKTGFSFVVLDSHKQIAAVSIQFDVCDLPKFDDTTLPMTAQKRFEIVTACDNLHPFIRNIKNNIEYGLINKGDCIDGYLGCVRSDLVSKGLSALIYASYSVIVGMKWKYKITNVSHPVTVRIVTEKIPLFVNKLMGMTVCYPLKMDFYQYIKNKFKIDKWYQSNLLSQKELILRRYKGAYLGCFLIRYDIIRQKYNMKQFWLKFVNALFLTKAKL
eukprot:525886_1